MYQVPTEVLNDIANSQPLYPPMQELFKATAQTLPALLQKHLDKPAERAGLDNSTTLAFRLTLPLWLENEAISSYIAEAHRPDLRAALPELTSLKECLQLAAMEFRLNQLQLVKLKRLLQKEAQRISREAMKHASN